MAQFFIRRPIFAMVLSIVITLAGGLAVGTLSLTQYPPVTPPTIQIDCQYPGASSEVVAESIAAPIEQQVNGVERMLYMTSQCTSDGSYTLTVTFEIGTNLNLAQVLVQNRVSLALPNLPDVVRATGVTTRKRSPEILMTVSLNSPNGRYDQLYLSNYALKNVRDELSRLPGISDVLLFGQRDYSMRVWVDPDCLAARGLTSSDVVQALREQSADVAAGQIGQPPLDHGGPLQFTLTTRGRLSDPSEFEQVVVRAGPNGVIKVKDLATVELASRSQDITNRFDRKPTIGMAIFLLSGANALETGDDVKAHMKQMSHSFPEDLIYEVGYDTTPFIRESIREVFKALRDAVILVAFGVLIFLRSWRAALIPLAAVPVAIVGTFAAMWAIGFSLNNLTLFGLVLAVGIVVDDAIVVVEAAQHHLEAGLSPQDATAQAMREVTGPVIAIGVVLAAVFVPCLFLSGILGEFFRQFSVTIAVSTLLSTFNSLTLSPALAALLLRKPPAKDRPTERRRWFWPTTWLTFGADLFDAGFLRLTTGYMRVVAAALNQPIWALTAYGGLIVAGWVIYQRLPAGFIPSQDKGYLIASVQLPDSSSAERTRAVLDQFSSIALGTEGVRHVNSVSGNSFVLSSYGSNFGSMFIILDDFAARRGKPNLQADAISAVLQKKVAEKLPEALFNIFGAPAVPGLGRSGGFRVMVEDRDGVGPKVLEGQTRNLIDRCSQQPGLGRMFTAYKASSPQIWLDVDRRACLSHGVALQDLFGVLQSTLGQRYVNDFNRFSRTWQVQVQSESRYRNQIEDIRNIRVRSKTGKMIPVGALLKASESSGPAVVTRHNMHPAATVNGSVAQGFSSGQAISLIERLAEQELPPGRMTIEWTEITFIEKLTRNTGPIIFSLSVCFVFLMLAALYENWTLPLAVILVVPICVVGSLTAVWIAQQDVNLFTQVGFVVLIGLACKNAILIVEFAKLACDRGVDPRTAVLDACRLRFRPILMTSVAFILGVVPLLIARGAGAEMRRALGTAVFGGMIGVTLFGVVLTPVFFHLIAKATIRPSQPPG